MISIDPILTSLANEKYRINTASPEAKKIDASVKHLKNNLSSYFDEALVEVIEFGSYKRDTILPKVIDPLRDVDLMVIFDHSNLKFNPITYRKHIQEFSDFYYPNSSSFKSKPTVVLEFNHLSYDLVPAHIDSDFFGDRVFYIPENDTDWIETDPHGFLGKINKKDENNKYLIKPVIRLLKAWNAKVGYPVSSFELEKEIVGITYYFLDTLEEYFFDVIDSLDATSNKIKALKENASKVRSAMENDDIKLATKWLAHILPMF